MNFPRQANARPYYKGHQVTYYQACGLPKSLVELTHSYELEDKEFRSLSQWRLDSPITRSPILDKDKKNLFGILESILTRGSLTLCSPEIERRLFDSFKANNSIDSSRLVNALQAIAEEPSCAQNNFTKFDSDEEKQAYKIIKDHIKKERLAWTLIPQVDLFGLAGGHQESNQRVDFLMLSPYFTQIKGVVVEIDGRQHENQEQADDSRDQTLWASGIHVIRIPANQIRNGKGEELDDFLFYLTNSKKKSKEDVCDTNILRWSKFTHQIQVALLSALKSGFLGESGNKILISIPEVLGNDDISKALCKCAVSEFQELVNRLAKIYNLEFFLDTFDISFCDDGASDFNAHFCAASDPIGESINNTFLITDQSLTFHFTAPTSKASPARIKASNEDLAWFLNYFFRKEGFLDGQYDAISRTLEGLDSVVLLPTGGGKSIIFQLAGLLLPGSCLVIDPIIALINDQIDNLRGHGIDRCIGISSELNQIERTQAQKLLGNGQYLFCYAAPERLQMESFRNALRSLTTYSPISLIAIDEAHCVSEWGHSFRTSYLNLGRNCREFCTTRSEAHPPLLALTGTASKIVLKDVRRELNINQFDSIITPKTFDRRELRYEVLDCRSNEIEGVLDGFLSGLPSEFGVNYNTFFHADGQASNAGLIFCPHSNGPFGVNNYYDILQNKLGGKVDCYSSKKINGFTGNDWSKKLSATSQKFKRNEISVLVCTKAFGMGIDKPNIRYTAHISLPESIESFYQEAGRAGRDKDSSICALIVSNDDKARAKKLLSPDTDIAQIRDEINALPYNNSDDITRALYFHIKSFVGVESEVEDVGEILGELEQLGNTQLQSNVSIAWNEYAEKGRKEKALHRLVLIGLVSDYTINYSSSQFNVRTSGADKYQIIKATSAYASAYQRQQGEMMELMLVKEKELPFDKFIEYTVTCLINFIYDHVELARRRALDEMLQAASASVNNSENLRSRIINYLEQTEWDDHLEKVRVSQKGYISDIEELLDKLITPQDAKELRAAAGRSLSSYPDIPAILMLRALSEALCQDCDPESVKQNISAAIKFSKTSYKLPPKEIASLIGCLVKSASGKTGASDLLISSVLLVKECDREVIRTVLTACSDDMFNPAIKRLLSNLKEDVTSIIEA